MTRLAIITLLAMLAMLFSLGTMIMVAATPVEAVSIVVYWIVTGLCALSAIMFWVFATFLFFRWKPVKGAS